MKELQQITDYTIYNDYLISCKLDDPTSKRSQLTRELLTYKVRKALELRKKKHKPKSFFQSLLTFIF